MNRRPRWPLRRPFARIGSILVAGLLTLLVATAGWAQPGLPSASDAGGSDSAPEIEPLLPEEGLFRAETWTRLGERLLTNTVDYLPRLLAAAMVLVLFVVLAKVASGIVVRALRRTKADPALPSIVGRLLQVAVVVLGLIMAAAQAGIAVGSLLAGVGVVGLAVGLAAQDSLSNVVAGLTILWDRPFRTGDRVTIAGEYGEIQEVGLRTTRIRTVDERDAILPNKDVIDEKIINHTRDPVLRLDIPLGISYDSDIAQAREVLLGAVQDHELLADSPRPAVVVTGLGDSSVDLELRVFLRDPNQERTATWQLLEVAKNALDDAGIVIPFPQRTLHWAPNSEPVAYERRA
ncbi:MAG: mechanosensitive ion channel [Thermoanaerobaculia bacterium]|nr:mechanosensitive ion channel [Thermoanaerobaculia bacterium]